MVCCSMSIDDRTGGRRSNLDASSFLIISGSHRTASSFISSGTVCVSFVRSMAIPVARVHLDKAHAAVPGLHPTTPKCTMIRSLLLAPPCAVILPSSPPKPSRADDVETWDAHKIKPGGTSDSPLEASASTLGGQRSPMDGYSSSPGRTSSCTVPTLRVGHEVRRPRA